MGRNSARRRDEPSGLGELFREGLFLTGAAIVRNPATVGGTTAFLVAMSFVSANALWYQPQRHDGAFFTTRALIQREPAPAPVPAAKPAPAPARLGATGEQPAAQVADETTASLPAGDPTVLRVQERLKGLELYEGKVDGLAGPQTTGAIQHYQRLVGLAPTGQIDDALLRQLGAAPAGGTAKAAALGTGGGVPIPSGRPSTGVAADAAPVAMQVAARTPDPHIVRIQAGLKAFGHDGIDLDGIVGARTRDAIKEFQSLFGLPVTGEPDGAVLAKMREIGLTE